MSPFASAAPFRGIVAIDGPSGAGKSTVARLLATRLGARYLDTGAMYRAITWAALRAGIPVDDVAAVTNLGMQTQLDISTDPNSPGIAVDGQPVDEDIRSSPVTASVSAISAVPGVRRRLVQLQRELIGPGGIVVEGRDIGSVVAPEAQLKVFLTASADARADRRSSEVGAEAPGDIAATAADLLRRDGLDSSRAVSPLQPAPDAILIDTTDLGIDDVVARLFDLATGRAPGEAAASP